MTPAELEQLTAEAQFDPSLMQQLQQYLQSTGQGTSGLTLQNIQLPGQYNSAEGNSDPYGEGRYFQQLGQLGYMPLSGSGQYYTDPATSPESLKYFNQTYGLNLRTPEDYYRYIYPNAGEVVNDPRLGQLLNVGTNPTGVRSLEYNPNPNEELMMALKAGGLAFGGAGLLSSLGALGAGAGSSAGLGTSGLSTATSFANAGLPVAEGFAGTGAAAGGAGGAAAGGGMFDFLNPSFNPLDPSTWYGEGGMSGIPEYNPSILDPGYTQGNFIDPSLNSQYLGAPYQQGFNLLDPSTYGGSGGSNLGLPSLPNGTSSLLQKLLGGAGGAGAGGGAGGQGLLSSLLGTLGSTVPSYLVGNWAMNQKPDLNPLYETYRGSAANALPFIQASQTPLREAQAMGYGDLLQSQSARGIRGSSFGDRDISQYLNTTNRGIANAGTNAAEAALGLQGTLAGRIPQAQSQNLAALAPILGGSLAGIGQGLRGESATNLGTNVSNLMANWFPSLFGA